MTYTGQEKNESEDTEGHEGDGKAHPHLPQPQCIAINLLACSPLQTLEAGRRGEAERGDCGTF